MFRVPYEASLTQGGYHFGPRQGERGYLIPPPLIRKEGMVSGPMFLCIGLTRLRFPPQTHKLYSQQLLKVT